MSTFVRRFRGFCFAALAWSATWTVLGAIFRIVWRTEAGLGFPTLRMILGTGLSWAFPGFIGGAAFALFLTLDERHRLDDWTMRSLGVRGATGAAIVPFIALVFHSLTTGHAFIGVLPMIAQYTVAGALCATGSFLLARRAPSSPESELRAVELSAQAT